MKIYKTGELVQSMNDQDIFCMSNLRGKNVCVPHKLSFSFYFSQRESSHAIRVKPVFNPNKISLSRLGSLELHGDWKYTPGPDDINVSNKQISEMKNFFKTYKVLFATVWENELPEDVVYDYFRGIIPLSELIKEFYFYANYAANLDKIKTIDSLEQYIRNYKIFNMWD
jgi:hypothetical protein